MTRSNRSLNRLGLLVATITTLIVVMVFGIILGVRALLGTKQEIALPSPTPAAAEQIISATDSDRDGLADEVESIYRTDPENPDTDGDATNDGDELLQLRDPIIPGPEDTLAAINEAGEIGTDTYTGKYLATFPAGATQADILSSDRLETFIEEERQALVPSAYTPSVQPTNDAGLAAIEAYLAAISSSHNENIVAVSSEEIAAALRTYLTERNKEDLDTISQTLASNFTLLSDITPPQEAAPLHSDLLSASQSLLENVQLLQNMKDDLVGGLIGAKNIEELGTSFADIAQQIAALEEKYNLE